MVIVNMLFSLMFVFCPAIVIDNWGKGNNYAFYQT